MTISDVGTVAIGHAPRLGQFGYMKQNDAVEGVILMRVGEQAQVILKKVEELTETLNRTILPPDVKIVPYYDRTELIQETTKTVERNLLRGMLLVLVILGLFLFSVRTALIVAVTIPFALLFSFICLDWAHIPANLLSIGAIDFGMIVDGAVVMVENIFRELAARHGQEYDLIDVIRAAAKDVERPIFYAIAVIIAGYLPIYVLTGPSGRLFRPMADTMAFALVGALLCTLTLLPVLCAVFLRKHVKEPVVPLYERVLRGVRAAARRQPAPSRGDDRRSAWRCSAPRCCSCRSSARSSCRTSTRARSGCARRCPTRSRSTRRRSWGRRCATSSWAFRRSRRSPTSSDVPTTAPTRSGSSTTSTSSGLKPYDDPAWSGADPHQAAAHRRDPAEAVGVSRHHLQLHAAGRGRRGRSGDRAEELAGREDLRPRPRHAREPRRTRCSA